MLRYSASVAVGVAVLASVMTMDRPKESSALEVLFPLHVFKSDATLFDPRHIDTIFDYYLLENLAVGLVRDSLESAAGYEGVLASHWEQLSPTLWNFFLRPNLEWSDGTPITAKDIAQHFEDLLQEPSRHLTMLRTVKRIETDGRHNIKFHFCHPTHAESILHELSLADSALIHPSNRHKDWSIVSGPYRVTAYDRPQKLLRLDANPKSALYSPDAPQVVHLRALKNPPTEFNEVFLSQHFDLYRRPMFPFAADLRQIQANAPQTFVGSKTMSYFFAFNPEHPEVRSTQIRIGLKEFFRAVFDNLAFPDQIEHETQMIPAGYGGRITSSFPSSEGVGSIIGKRIDVVMDPILRELAGVDSRVDECNRKFGTDVHFRYTEFWPRPKLTRSDLAYFSTLQGNQKDPAGTWSFLFSMPEGDLALFRNDVKREFDALTSSVDEQNYRWAAHALHERVLREAFAIPFAVEASAYLHSKRINIQRFNPFDMRMRFYQIRWN